MRDQPIVPSVAPVRHQDLHRIAVRWRDQEANICQVIFRGDSFLVAFPYHPDSAGVLARIPMRVVAPGVETQINFGAVGFKTQHKIKYSHYASGDCHFSQDGRIYTKVRNVSYDLSVSRRHLFSVHAQGIHQFARSVASRPANYFDLGDIEMPPVVRIVGRWYNHVVPPGVVNPITLAMSPGYEGPAMACCPRVGSQLDGNVVVLEAFVHRILDPKAEFNMLFVGGFGPEMHDQTKESTALLLSYPGDVSTMPSIDYAGSRGA